jgi:VanZ family protein
VKKYWLPVILWAAFIFALSCVPGKDIPNLPIPNFHKLVHLIEYSVLGLLLIRALSHTVMRLSTGRLILLSMAIISIFAFSDEWHQTFVPGRHGCIADAVNDIIYAVIGIFVYKRIIRR